MTRHGFWRRLAIGLLVLSGALAIVAAVLVTTEAGRVALARIAAQLASAPNRQIALSGLASPDFGTLSARGVSVADEAGIWLSADNVTVRWSPRRLFHGTLGIENVRADRVAVARRPTGGNRPLAPPRLPLWLDIGTLALPRVELAESVLGVADALSLVGRMRLLPGDSGPLVDGAVEARRLADPAAALSLMWAYSAATDILSVDGALNQPPGGLFQAATGMRPELPLTARLAGSGGLADWRGELDIEAGAAGTGSATATVRRDGPGMTIVVAAHSDIARAFTGAAGALLAGRPRLDLSLRLPGDGSIAVDTLTLDSPVATVSASGAANADRTAWSAKFRGTVASSDALPGLLPPGVAFRDLAVEGDWALRQRTAEGRVAIGVNDAALSELAADRIQATLVPSDADRFRLDGEANGVRLAERDAGKPVLFSAEGRYTDLTVSLTAVTASIGSAAARFEGTADSRRIEGKATMTAASLEDLSGLVGRDLAGTADVSADVAGTPAERSLVLAVQARAENLSLGVPALDRLFTGALSMSGGVRLSPDAIVIDNGTATLPGVEMRASGALGGRTGLTANVTLDDLARIDDRLSGAATFGAVATGDPWAPEIVLTAKVPTATAAGRTVEDVTARYAGRIPAGALAGSIVFDGRIAGLPVSATARVAGYPATLSASDLSARIASVTVTGTLALQPGTLPAGSLTVSAPRLAELAPLLGVDAAGSLNGTVALPAAEPGAIPRIEANIANLRVGTVSVSRLSIAADEFDAAARRVSGNVSGGGVRIGEIAVDNIRGRVSGDPSGLGMDLEFALPDGTARFAGDLRRSPGGAVLSVRDFSASRNGETLRLAQPTDLTISGGAVAFTDLTIAGGAGRAVLSGSVGRTLDLTARADDLPLSAVGLFVPRFGAAGRIDGNATLSGPVSDLSGNYDVRVANLSFGELRRAGIDALDLTAAGRFAGTRATARGRIDGPGGAALSFDGTIPLTASGGVALDVRGALDLRDVNRAFRITGGDLSGRLSVDGRVEGPVARAGFAGTVGLAGGRYVEPAAGLDFRDLAGTASANGRQLTIRSLTARAGNGGRVSASGTVALGGEAGPVADIETRAENARVLSSGAATLDVSGAVRLRGALARVPSVTGSLTVDRLDVALPRHLPQRVAALDVKHRNAPPNLQRLADRRTRRAAAGESGNFNAALDLAISAPGRIFIRGQGLEAELEGDIVLRGTIASPATGGAFRLRRGSMSVLAQRFDITSATLTFAGDVDPALDIVSRTRAADITAIFRVTGTASAPEFHISSEPPMAEDEILSRLLFDKASADLTAGEALALAQAASQLAGFSTGSDFLDTLRRKTGLDRLTVSTDAAGNPVVDAGRYVTDRAYLGIRQGADADSTRATVDIDITRELKAHGEIGTDGRSKFGVTVEREY